MAGEPFRITGPAGEIEALSEAPAGPPSALAVICHPHPLYGGSMGNKVVHMLAAGLRERGAQSLRFNFRGVGHSAGEFDNGEGETGDLCAVVEQAQQRFPDLPLWLAGFSFGAWVAARGVTLAGLRPRGLLLVAPPVNMYDFAGLPGMPVPWMVIQGRQDEIVPADAVAQWVKRQQPAPLFVALPDAGHFFHGRLNALKAAVTANFPPPAPEAEK